MITSCHLKFSSTNNRFVFNGKPPEAKPSAEQAPAKPAETVTPDQAKAKRESTLSDMKTVNFGSLEAVLPAEAKNNIKKVTEEIRKLMISLNTTLEQVEKGVVADMIRQALVSSVRKEVGLVLKGLSLDPVKVTPESLNQLLGNLSKVMPNVEYNAANGSFSGFKTQKVTIGGMEYYGIYDGKNLPQTIKLYHRKAGSKEKSPAEAGEEQGFTKVDLDPSTNTVNVGITTKVTDIAGAPVNVAATAGTYGPGAAISIGGDSGGVRLGIYRDPKSNSQYGNVGVDKRLPNGATISVDAFTTGEFTAGKPPATYITYAMPNNGLAFSVHAGADVTPQANIMGGPPPKPDSMSGDFQVGGSIGKRF